MHCRVRSNRSAISRCIYLACSPSQWDRRRRRVRERRMRMPDELSFKRVSRQVLSFLIPRYRSVSAGRHNATGSPSSIVDSSPKVGGTTRATKRRGQVHPRVFLRRFSSLLLSCSYRIINRFPLSYLVCCSVFLTKNLREWYLKLYQRDIRKKIGESYMECIFHKVIN